MSEYLLDVDVLSLGGRKTVGWYHSWIGRHTGTVGQNILPAAAAIFSALLPDDLLLLSGED